LIDSLDKQDSGVWIRGLNKQLEAFLIRALPIKETMDKLARNGPPKVPLSMKLGTLLQWGKK
jgi:hypothetical protein